MKTVHLLLLCLFAFSSFSQDEINYYNPPSLLADGYRIDAADIISTVDYCKLKLVFTNQSKTAYLVFKGDKTGFEYDGFGKYYPKRTKELVVSPSDKANYIVRVEKDIDYRIGEFKLNLEGLMTGTPTGKMNAENMALSNANLAKYTHENMTIEFEEFEGKKGKYSAKITWTFNGADDELLVIDPNQMRITSDSGAEIGLNWNKTDIITLRPGDSEKLKLNFESTAEKFELNQSTAYQNIKLTTLSLEPFLIKSPVEVKKAEKVKEEKEEPIAKVSQEATKTGCPPFMGQQSGSVKMKIYSEEKECFKLDIDGFPAITDFTSNAFVYTNPGRRRFTLTMADGTVIEEKSYIADTYDEIGYRVKSKGDEYAMKYVVGDQVMNAKGKQDLEALMAKTKATNQAQLDKMGSGSSGSGGSGSGSSSNGGTSCFSDASSGTKTVKLKITWKGNPVVGHGVEIKFNGTALGHNTTDGSGNVSIKVQDLPSSKIDVYGCKGQGNWSVTGDWVVLDSSNSFHLKLEELAEFMAKMLGQSVDELGASWGM